MRNPKIILKIQPKVTIVEVKEVGSKPIISTVGKREVVQNLISEIKFAKDSSSSSYDELWKLRDILSRKVTEQLDNPDVDKTFVINYLKQKITAKQVELNIPGAGAI